jgi:hypothetical protein
MLTQAWKVGISLLLSIRVPCVQGAASESDYRGILTREDMSCIILPVMEWILNLSGLPRRPILLIIDAPSVNIMMHQHQCHLYKYAAPFKTTVAFSSRLSSQH